MLMFQRTVAINTGKGETAMMWAAQIMQYINDKYDAGMSIHTGMFSDIGKVLWVAHFENLAHLEEITGALTQDAEYQAMLKSSWEQELFVAGTVNDRVFMTP